MLLEKSLKVTQHPSSKDSLDDDEVVPAAASEAEVFPEKEEEEEEEERDKAEMMMMMMKSTKADDLGDDDDKALLEVSTQHNVDDAFSARSDSHDAANPRSEILASPNAAPDTAAQPLAGAAFTQASAVVREEEGAARPTEGWESRGGKSFLQELLVPTGGTVGGIPVILIYMTVAIVGVILFLQVAGWSLDNSDHHCSRSRYQSSDSRASGSSCKNPPNPPHGSQSRHSLPHEVQRRPFQTPAGTEKSLRSAPASALPVVPNLSAKSLASTASRAPSMSWVAQLQASEADASSDILCPALILPQGKAQFSISYESLQRLGQGYYPAEILGPTGRQLLHARVPPHSGTDASPTFSDQRWLEMTTTATSRYPHACVGPIPLESSGPLSCPLEIRGPRGDTFGLLEQRGPTWCSVRNGRVLLTLEPEVGTGRVMAFSRAEGSDQSTVAAIAAPDGAMLRLQVSPGVDALLALLSFLAVALLAPETVTPPA
mmetsp:Transcript_67732/g.141566  ORF Transcript_67732/g.141566 Transcript_67732/m.141566 type:complete len:488 (-) Transcript_67732:48-1511(-)